MIPSVSNQVTVIGRLGNDPEPLGEGGRGVRLSLGIDRSFHQGGRRVERIEWFEVVCSNALATSRRRLVKGDRVAVAGALATEIRADRGEAWRFVVIHAASVELLDAHDSPKTDRVTHI